MRAFTKSRKVRRANLVRVAGLVVVALIAIAIPATTGASTAQDAAKLANGGPPQLQSRVSLPTGAVKLTYSDNTVVVASPDAQVDLVTDAAGNTTSVNIAMAGESAGPDIASRAGDYAAHGRSTRADAKAAGIDPSTISEDSKGANSNSSRTLQSAHQIRTNFMTANSVYDSACAVINSTPTYWQGCVTRKGTSSTDPTHYYLADSSQAAGHANVGGYWLTQGSTHHNYPNADLIVQWNPGSDISGASCSTITIGMSGYGASLSDSFTRCPTVIHITNGTQNFDAAWQGCQGSQSTPGVAAQTFTKVPNGSPYGMTYSVGDVYKTSSC